MNDGKYYKAPPPYSDEWIAFVKTWNRNNNQDKPAGVLDPYEKYEVKPNELERKTSSRD